MKKKLTTLGLMVVMVVGLAHGEAQGPGTKGATGIMFDISGVLGSIGPIGDGFQSGVGAKTYFTPELAGRGLVNFYFTSNGETETSQSSFGLGLGLEYHFKSSKISPYLGGLLGLSMSGSSAQGNSTSNPAVLYLGGMGGAEVKLLDGLSLFCEYNGVIILGESITIRLGQDGGIGNNAVLGLIIYL